MSFEVIPPFSDDEVRDLGIKLALILGAILAICMAANVWRGIQIDRFMAGQMARKEAIRGQESRR